MTDWRNYPKPQVPLADVLAEARSTYADLSQDEISRLVDDAVKEAKQTVIEDSERAREARSGPHSA